MALNEMTINSACASVLASAETTLEHMGFGGFRLKRLAQPRYDAAYLRHLRDLQAVGDLAATVSKAALYLGVSSNLGLEASAVVVSNRRGTIRQGQLAFITPGEAPLVFLAPATIAGKLDRDLVDVLKCETVAALLSANPSHFYALAADDCEADALRGLGFASPSVDNCDPRLLRECSRLFGWRDRIGFDDRGRKPRARLLVFADALPETLLLTSAGPSSSGSRAGFRHRLEIGGNVATGVFAAAYEFHKGGPQL